MKNFKFDLNAKVAIYVPSTTDVNVPTDNKAFVNKVMTKFSEWFGGCTSTPAKQPTEGKVFGNVIEECLEAFFSACCEDVKYAESQEYFADFADNNELEFYENDICIRHR